MDSPTDMKVIRMKAYGGPEQLVIGNWPRPKPGPDEILVRVAATALNRADTLQRMGKYPPPDGASPILGLEMAGTIVEKGTNVTRWNTGDRVCGLLSGGGYAEYVVIHEAMAMPVPAEISFIEAAAVPEAFLTAYQALRWLASMEEGEWVLIHAGASGVGTAAIQLARQMGAGKIVVTASAGKHSICRELGADLAIDYRSEDFEAVLKDFEGGRGVDIVVDFIGAPYFQRNLNVLRTDGRLVLLAFLGGLEPEDFSLLPMLGKRLTVMGSTLRSRTLNYKIRLTKDFRALAWPLFQNHFLRPVIDKVYDWRDVADAHRYMEANKNKGKIVMEVK